MSVRKRTRVILILVAVVVVAMVTWFIARSPDTSKLAAYKAELRAKGENLSWAELGYPRSLEPGNAMNRLLAGISRLGPSSFQPWRFDLMQFATAGKARAAWQARLPPRTIFGTNQLTWSELAVESEAVIGALEQIRAALTNPPARFIFDPKDSFGGPNPPFVELRTAAQWLTADLVLAMQADQKARARSDVVAVSQLAQVHREDPTLVSQMIRTAITGLGLVATWEALQAEGWADADLAAMQRAWEEVDLLAGLEQALVGERAFGEMSFTMARNRDTWPHVQNSQRTMGQALGESIVEPYWRMHMDSDELLMLRHYQRTLEALRQFQGEAAWPAIKREFDESAAELSGALSHPIKRFRYQLSSIIIPNAARASATVVRNETLRRLTVTVLALERHRLRHEKYPADLKSLVPELLAAVPRDLMSTQPLSYRLNTDGAFTLYSFGEDGRDDGGDPQPVGVTNRFELWNGRDAVWPRLSE